MPRIARSLAQHQVDYAIIGGFAVIHHGYQRTTADIDLLIDPSPENVERVRQALTVLEDKASLEVDPTDIENYTVVRVADEVVVDLLGKACGLTLADIRDNVEVVELNGVPICYGGWSKQPLHSAADPSRLAALLVGCIPPVCALLAPCQTGASTASVLTTLFRPASCASAADLIRLKQTMRPKDAVDRMFLEELVRSMADESD